MAAYGELYDLYLPEMYKYALFCLSSVENARDAVQDAALEGMKSICKLKKAGSVKPWLFKILSNVCKRKQREKYAAEFTELEKCFELSENDMTAKIENALFIAESISKLDQDEKEIIDLSLFAGLNSKEIAKVTGLNPGTVRSKLSRALAKIRKEASI